MMKSASDKIVQWLWRRTSTSWRFTTTTCRSFRGFCLYHTQYWRQIDRWWRIRGWMRQTFEVGSVSAVFPTALQCSFQRRVYIFFYGAVKEIAQLVPVTVFNKSEYVRRWVSGMCVSTSNRMFLTNGIVLKEKSFWYHLLYATFDLTA